MGFGMAEQLEETLFTALAKALKPRLNDFNAQQRANTAWAFA